MIFTPAPHPHHVWLCLLLLTALTLPGCMTTRVMTSPGADCCTPDNVNYTKTTVTAYFWGLKQPTNVITRCDSLCNPGRRFNYLNGVTVKSTFGHYLLATVTLGIVNKRRVQWCCAPYVPQPDSL